HRQPQQSYMLRRGGIGLIAFGVVASSVVPAHACGLAAPAIQDEGTGSVSSSFQPYLASASEDGGMHYLVPQAEGSGGQAAPVALVMAPVDGDQPVVAPVSESARPVVPDHPHAVQSGPLDVASSTVTTAPHTTATVTPPVSQSQESSQ